MKVEEIIKEKDMCDIVARELTILMRLNFALRPLEDIEEK